METSYFLAKFWGWYLFVFFLVLSVKPERIKQIFNDFKDSKFALLTAFLAFIIGLLNILFHNYWDTSWIIIITLLGWICFGLGIVLFVIPEKTAEILITVNIKMAQVLYILLFLLGIYLLNMGYELLSY